MSARSEDLLVTGVGTVGPHGAGLEALAGGLAAGEAAWGPIDRSAGFHRAGSATLAGLVDPAGLRPWLDPARARRMSLPSRMAVVAARLALADAGLAGDELERRAPRIGVCVGTAFGPSTFTVRLLDQIRSTGPETASPFLFMESVANACAGQVAIESSLRGPNATVVAREASALAAVAQGASLLRAGACDAVLVGGVEEMAPITHAILDRLGALSRGARASGAATADEAPLPFDARRDGFIVSEGATLLLLERARDVEARGGRARARLEATVRASDPSATELDWGTGSELLARSLARGLERAAIDASSIDRVVSGASGSRSGDRLEAQVLRALFGPGDVPVTHAPKACTGEYGGGFLAAALLAMEAGGLGPTPGFESVDPELGLRPHDGRELPAPERTLVSSLAAGGGAVWLVLAPA